MIEISGSDRDTLILCAFRPPGSLSGVRSRAGSRSAHVERTYAWINQFRHLAIRYERHADLYRAFLVLAAAIICFRAISRFC